MPLWVKDQGVWKPIRGGKEPVDEMPTGAIIYGAFQSAPDGWLVCDGSSVPVAQYGALYSVIGNAFGGNATNFNVPDLRGQFLRGWDDGKGVDPGRAFGSSQADGVGPLTLNDPGHVHGVQVTAGSDAGANIAAIGPGDIAGTNTTEPKQTGISFSGNIAETRPKNVALLAIIKT